MKNGTKDLQKMLRSRNCKSITYEKPKIKHLSMFVTADIDD